MKFGSLCSGYGGLEMGVQAAIGGTTAWVSDVDKGACKILAHRFPDVPNIGDMTVVDWTQVEPVEVLTAGYPCQPFSHAGTRKGTNDVRHLWPHVREAVRVLRPGLTVLENVAGHRSLGFDRVLGDLAEDGMHVRWTSLRAADIGAPHGRERLFILVTPDAERGGRDGWTPHPVGRSVGRATAARSGKGALLPTPTSSDTNGVGAHGDGGLDLRTAVSLLPTPRATRGGSNTETRKLLPTPMVGSSSPAAHGQISGQYRDQMAEALERWGDYADAIARWEALTRPAPPPTQPSRRGTPQLAPAFSEWLMGLPAGWVTDVPGITRNEALKALGNGVVPAQAAAALRIMLSWSEAVA